MKPIENQTIERKQFWRDECLIGDNIGNRIGDKFEPNKTQKDILAIMRKDPTVSARKIAGVVHIAARNVETHIKRLKEAGLITRDGSSRKGRWIVK